MENVADFLNTKSILKPDVTRPRQYKVTVLLLLMVTLRLTE